MNDFCYYKTPQTQLFRIFYLNLQQPFPSFYKMCKHTWATSFLNEYYDMKHLSHLTLPLCHLLRAKLSLCVVTLLLLSLMGCSRSERRYVIAISQCSEDVWREKLNQELRIAALYYNNVDLRIASAYDDVKLQTEQIDKFVQDNVDLLVVAPGQVSISPAIDRAYEKGIPVIIFDRRTHSDKYTAFIGADNREIGRQMGGFLAAHKGGAKQVLEICGLDTSSPAMERQEGSTVWLRRTPTLRLPHISMSTGPSKGLTEPWIRSSPLTILPTTMSLRTTTAWRWGHVAPFRSMGWISAASSF